MGLFSSIGKIFSNPIASIAGDILGTSMQNTAAKGVSNAQMRFQKEMSDTAHQREVKDLVAAGLNPVLSATGGVGASTPGGSSYQPQNVLSGAGNSARAALLLREQIKNVMADTAAKKAQAGKTAAETVVTSRNIPLLDLQNKILGVGVNTGKEVLRKAKDKFDTSDYHFNPRHPIENLKSNYKHFFGGK